MEKLDIVRSKFQQHKADSYDKIYTFDQIAENVGLPPTQLYKLINQLDISATYRGVADHKGYFSQAAYKKIRNFIQDQLNESAIVAINKQGYYARFQILEELEKQGYKVRENQLARVIYENRIKSKQFSIYSGSTKFIAVKDAKILISKLKKIADSKKTIKSERTFAPVPKISQGELLKIRDEVISIAEMAKETGLIANVFRVAFNKAGINPAYYCLENKTYYYNRVSYQFILQKFSKQRKVTF